LLDSNCLWFAIVVLFVVGKRRDEVAKGLTLFLLPFFCL
jgi:hypothetical protein